jgi:hypothetical protein
MWLSLWNMAIHLLVPRPADAAQPVRNVGDTVESLKILVHHGEMSRRTKLLSLVCSGLVLGGLGVFFVLVGLETADKVASVLGLFVGLAGLGLSVAGSRQTERAEERRQAIASVGVNRATAAEKKTVNTKAKEREGPSNSTNARSASARQEATPSREEQPAGDYLAFGRRALAESANGTKALDSAKGGPPAIER